MDMNSILARTLGGLAVRLGAIGLAVYVVVTAWRYVSHVFNAIHGVM